MIGQREKEAAVVKCPFCKVQVSSDGKYCSNCSKPLRPKWYQKNSLSTIIIMIIAVIFFAGCLYIVISTMSDENTEKATTTQTFNQSEGGQNVSKKTYSSILDEYRIKLEEATPKLIEEYKQEAAQNTNGLNGLAELSNEKILKLAEISNNGITEMAELMYESGSGKYSEYQEWVGKLQEIYIQEAGKITDAYMDSARS